MGTSLIRNRHPVGPYSRTMPDSYGAPRGGAISYERGTPVHAFDGYPFFALCYRLSLFEDCANIPYPPDNVEHVTDY